MSQTWEKQVGILAFVSLASGLQAVEELRSLVPDGIGMAQFALRWILMFDAVSCAILGAKNRAQAVESARASDVPALGDATLARIRALYDRAIRTQVHQRW